MERNSTLEHFANLAMPRKKIGLMKSTAKKPLTRKQLEDSKRRDDRKDSSLRKPNEVPRSASKSRSHRS